MQTEIHFLVKTLQKSSDDLANAKQIPEKMQKEIAFLVSQLALCKE